MSKKYSTKKHVSELKAAVDRFFEIEKELGTAFDQIYELTQYDEYYELVSDTRGGDKNEIFNMLLEEMEEFQKRKHETSVRAKALAKLTAEEIQILRIPKNPDDETPFPESQ